jgi:hypothetical protein
VSKIDKEYVNIFDSCVCMRAWGACGLASGGYEGVRADPWEVGGLGLKSHWMHCHHMLKW